MNIFQKNWKNLCVQTFLKIQGNRKSRSTLLNTPRPFSMLTGFFPGVWVWACWRAEHTQRIRLWFSRGGSIPYLSTVHSPPSVLTLTTVNGMSDPVFQRSQRCWRGFPTTHLGWETPPPTTRLSFISTGRLSPHQHLCQGRGGQREKITLVNKPEPTISL